MQDAILGISSDYHDSAAALLVNGEIIAAAHEERFTRKKQIASFPFHATTYALGEAGVTPADLTAVVFYDKPLRKLDRLWKTYHAFAPRGLGSYLSTMPVWFEEKRHIRETIRKELAKLGPGSPRVLFSDHHLSHAASAFFPSPFVEAAILIADGLGEWATTTIGRGQGKDITVLRHLDFPHSLGLLYSAITSYCGFKVNSGECKLMGLAPYGDPDSEETRRFMDFILSELVDLRQDGSLLLNMDYFDFPTGLTMCRDDRVAALLGLPRREEESEITRPYMNLALAIQQVAEEAVFRMADTAWELTGSDNLVMAGGVALNCVATGKLLRRGPFKNIWVQPAAGDAGGALGAALAAHHIWLGRSRSQAPGKDAMKGAYLGPSFDESHVARLVAGYGADCRKYDDFQALCRGVAARLARGDVVGWFQGRMEYGPRALGNRSIMGDPRSPDMQKKLNLKIKYREGFRPFAPSVLMEDADEYFELEGVSSPYMLLVAPVREKRRKPLPDGYRGMELYERLYHLRSDIPSVTHMDYSARIQTVHKDTNERYHRVISAFKELTGYGVIVNTSFNVRGEPIVCTPEDAYRCFMRTGMDCLVIGDCFFDKKDQPEWKEEGSWGDEYELD